MRWASLLLGTFILAVSARFAIAQPPASVPSQVIQFNICNAGQWFTTFTDGKCELHTGSTENSSVLAFISAKDYQDWRDGKWKISEVYDHDRYYGFAPSSIVDHHVEYYGNEAYLRQLAKKVENGSGRNPQFDSCIPKLPAHLDRTSAVPGCVGGAVVAYALRNAVRCPPNSNIFELARLVVGGHLEVSPLTILPQSRLFKDLGADDLDGTEIVMAIEEYFDLEFPEVDVEKTETMQDLVRFIQGKVCH